MTGIEMLRNLARHCRYESVGGCTTVVTSVHAAAIEAIADQLECEHDSMVADSQHDALPEEDRDAIGWVRARGGLVAVTMERSNLWGIVGETCRRLGVECVGDLTTNAQNIWREIGGLKRLLGESVPRAACDRHIARRQRQIDESHAALRRRNARVAELEREVGHQQDVGAVHLERIGELVDENKELRARVENQRASLEGLTAAIGELRPRLMPEDMEWPRFEDGEPVRVGDSAPFGTDGVMEVEGVEINRFGYVLHGSIDDGMRECVDGDDHGVAVKRLAPKVLDAEGNRIEPAMDVWWICEGDELGIHAEKLHVENIGEDGLVTCSPFNDGTWVELEPSELYVNKPVPAADGRPLREGETVWNVKTGERYVVGAFAGGCVNVSDGRGGGLQLLPSQLTHERPIADTWERLEEDAEGIRRDIAMYLGDCSQSGFEEPRDSVQSRVIDLVRRAKALAERGA